MKNFTRVRQPASRGALVAISGTLIAGSVSLIQFVTAVTFPLSSASAATKVFAAVFAVAFGATPSILAIVWQWRQRMLAPVFVTAAAVWNTVSLLNATPLIVLVVASASLAATVAAWLPGTRYRTGGG